LDTLPNTHVWNGTLVFLYGYEGGP
jgi:hypothetical protein